MSLDPKTNRQTREAEKAKKAAEEPPLNPLFPHRRQPFDPFFFALEREPASQNAASNLPNPS